MAEKTLRVNNRADYALVKEMWVKHYDGTVASTVAKIKAFDGLTLSKAVVDKVSCDLEVINAIKKLDDTAEIDGILSREGRQRLWTQAALDVNIKMSDRLKASELLGKSAMDFTDKVEINGKLDVGIGDLIDEIKNREEDKISSMLG